MWTPDGKELAVTVTYELEIWDLDQKHLIATLSHNNGIGPIAWAPDGKHLAFASGREQGSLASVIIVWDLSKGYDPRNTENTVVLAGSPELINDLAWSPDSKRIATASSDNTAQVWDVASEQNVITINDHSDLVESVAWSSDGEYIASGGGRLDSTLRIWEVSGKRDVYTFRHPDGVGIERLAWSPDNLFIASGSDDHKIRVFEVK
jgi:WD40 repeat protein